MFNDSGIIKVGIIILNLCSIIISDYMYIWYME